MPELTVHKKSQIGDQIYQLIEELYPICRSITGDGVRQSLRILQEYIPLEILEIPSGTEVFDWTIPKEWNIRDAWVKNSAGEKVIDFNNSNLHVLNYSIPINRKMTLAELKPYLYSLPEQPELIPYRTSYYNESWGFCITHHQRLALEEDTYQVYINSTLEPGSMTHGELFIEGASQDEVLISCHICHPSLCNDNLSGVAVATHMARSLIELELHYSYRFLFIPGTIGSIAWLAQNEERIDRIKHGLVLSCVGDPGAITYKRSRQGSAGIDRIVERVLTDSGEPFQLRDFSPYGYDERQFCSPGFDLPVGCLMRTPYGEYPEYHTSGDNLDFVDAKALADSLVKLQAIINTIEDNRTYLNLNPKCEPNLGKRRLYKLTGGHARGEHDQLAILWVLNLSDGHHSLVDISKRSGISYDRISSAAGALVEVGLLSEIEA